MTKYYLLAMLERKPLDIGGGGDVPNIRGVMESMEMGQANGKLMEGR